jgi:hypothetical protein
MLSKYVDCDSVGLKVGLRGSESSPNNDEKSRTEPIDKVKIKTAKIAKTPEGIPPEGSGWKSEKLVIELGVFNDLPNTSIFLDIRDSSFIFTQI